MKKYYTHTYYLLKGMLLLVVSTCSLLCSAQQLMLKITKAGRPTMMFSSVIADGEGFVVSGTTSNPVAPYRGRAVIGKLDRNGNFENIAYIYDSIPKNYGSFFNSLIRTSDNDYAFVGNSSDSVPRVLFVKSNPEFETTVWEYDSTDLFSFQGLRLLEDQNSFYIAGIIRSNNVTGYHDNVLIKIDANGNRMWQKKYGTLSRAETATSIIKLSNGNIMIGSLQNNLVLGNEKCNTWLFEVDTSGEIVRQWFDSSDSTYGAYGLQQTADGGFFYASQKKYVQTMAEGHPIGTIVRMDNQFNRLWKYEGDRSSMYTGLFDVEQLSDGSFVACGSRHIHANDSSIVSAWVVKVSSIGQEIWSKEYSGSTVQGTLNFLNDIDVLPNGNLVAVGETRNGQEGQFGLLLVMDSNGCEIENCVVGIDDIEPDVEINVYPNPFTDEVHVSIDNAILYDAAITISNPLGQVVYTGEGNNLNSNYTIDLHHLQAGIYYISVATNGERLVRTVVKD